MKANVENCFGFPPRPPRWEMQVLEQNSRGQGIALPTSTLYIAVGVHGPRYQCVEVGKCPCRLHEAVPERQMGFIRSVAAAGRVPPAHLGLGMSLFSARIKPCSARPGLPEGLALHPSPWRQISSLLIQRTVRRAAGLKFLKSPVISSHTSVLT